MRSPVFLLMLPLIGATDKDWPELRCGDDAADKSQSDYRRADVAGQSVDTHLANHLPRRGIVCSQKLQMHKFDGATFPMLAPCMISAAPMLTNQTYGYPQTPSDTWPASPLCWMVRACDPLGSEPPRQASQAAAPSLAISAGPSRPPRGAQSEMHVAPAQRTGSHCLHGIGGIGVQTVCQSRGDARLQTADMTTLLTRAAITIRFM